MIEVTDSELLTIPEVQAKLKIGRTRLYELLASGQIESVRIGTSRRIPLSAISRFINDLRNNASQS